MWFVPRFPRSKEYIIFAFCSTCRYAFPRRLRSPEGMCGRTGRTPFFATEHFFISTAAAPAGIAALVPVGSAPAPSHKTTGPQLSCRACGTHPHGLDAQGNNLPIRHVQHRVEDGLGCSLATGSRLPLAFTSAADGSLVTAATHLGFTFFRAHVGPVATWRDPQFSAISPSLRDI